jgi:hypothetical protein
MFEIDKVSELTALFELQLDVGTIFQIEWMEFPGLFAIASDSGLHFFKLV